jgi:Flp pilus assembly protein TadD
MLLLVGCIGAYHNSFEGPFFFDDLTAITENPHVRQIWPPWSPLTTPADTSISGRPLVAFSFALNYALGGLDVFSYHLVNLILHLFSALLVFGIARRTMEGERLRTQLGGEAQWIALAVSLLWMLHPVQTESVTYIVQRTELLVGLFYLLTLYCFIRGAAQPRRSIGMLLAALASCAAGMASKEVMVTCPVMILIYDRVFVGSSLRQIVRERAWFYTGLAACWGILALLLASGPRDATAGLHFSGLIHDYAWIQLSAVVHYLGLVLWPDPLIIDYGNLEEARPLVPPLLATVIMLALLGGTVIALFRRPALGFLGLWFFIIISPTSSIVPITTEVAAERRLYLPSLALITLLVLAGHFVLRRLARRLSWPDPRRAAAAALAVGLLAITYGVLTRHRNETFRSTRSIWADAVASSPDNPRARLNLGTALLDLNRVDEAIAQLRRALELRPKFPQAMSNLGGALAKKEQFGAAERLIRSALRLDPQLADAHGNLANVLMHRGQRAAAMKHFKRALALAPNKVTHRMNMGWAFELSGDHVLAIRQFELVLAGQPRHVGALRVIGRLMVRHRRPKEAIPYYRRAIALRPDDAELHNDLGVALALSGGLAQAIRHFRMALKLSPTHAKARDNLTRALARTGR